ncbi:cytochrome o ubiquinol/quinol oxidase subunit IV [Rhabdochlamydiaceae symbiont of Dictyostelium giganteum]|uniref:cytochrome o ubiquinol oxidase subunit IV n=1 Tax=Rhabdochlamydiaceae symbiont of Dictyostelium giganteum TaxID=3342349 RepID=UPI00384DFCD1
MMSYSSKWNQKFIPTITGWALSSLIILGTYLTIKMKLVSSHWISLTVIVLSFLQILVQMICFLQIGFEENSQWGMGILAFTLCILFVVIGGSLWVMNNLNHQMMVMGA